MATLSEDVASCLSILFSFQDKLAGFSSSHIIHFEFWFGAKTSQCMNLITGLSW